MASCAVIADVDGECAGARDTAIALVACIERAFSLTRVLMVVPTTKNRCPKWLLLDQRQRLGMDGPTLLRTYRVAPFLTVRHI